MCSEAVANYACVLKYVPFILKTREICILAVKKNRYTLKYVPYLLRTHILESI